MPRLRHGGAERVRQGRAPAVLAPGPHMPGGAEVITNGPEIARNSAEPLGSPPVTCCHKRCAHPPVPGTTRCEKHTDHHRAEVGQRRRERRAAGVCGLCGASSVPGKVRCPKHDSSTGAYKCGACGVRGHNRRTCPAGEGPKDEGPGAEAPSPVSRAFHPGAPSVPRGRLRRLPEVGGFSVGSTARPTTPGCPGSLLLSPDPMPARALAQGA